MKPDSEKLSKPCPEEKKEEKKQILSTDPTLFDKLPLELISMIAELLPLGDVVSFANTSQSCYKALFGMAKLSEIIKQRIKDVIKYSIRKGESVDTLCFSAELIYWSNLGDRVVSVEEGTTVMDIMEEVFIEEKDGLLRNVKSVEAGSRGLKFFPDLGDLHLIVLDVSSNNFKSITFSGSTISLFANNNPSLKEVSLRSEPVTCLVSNAKVKLLPDVSRKVPKPDKKDCCRVS